MKAASARNSPLELQLAGLLRWGTWVGSAVVALGLASSSMPVVTAGVALFILLPVLRVISMLIFFGRTREYRFVAIAATVLAIILLGFAVGLHLAKSALPA